MDNTLNNSQKTKNNSSWQYALIAIILFIISLAGTYWFFSSRNVEPDARIPAISVEQYPDLVNDNCVFWNNEKNKITVAGKITNITDEQDWLIVSVDACSGIAEQTAPTTFKIFKKLIDLGKVTISDGGQRISSINLPFEEIRGDIRVGNQVAIEMQFYLSEEDARNEWERWEGLVCEEFPTCNTYLEYYKEYSSDIEDLIVELESLSSKSDVSNLKNFNGQVFYTSTIINLESTNDLNIYMQQNVNKI